MARRATYIKALRNDAHITGPVLNIAGGYEFANTDGAPPSHARLAFLAKAFDLLRQDALFITPHEREIFAKQGLTPDPKSMGSDKLEQHVLPVQGGAKVGLLVLPPLLEQAKTPTPALLAQIDAAVRKLRATTQLVVALSPWGFGPEQELLKSTIALPDLLLGSGNGIGLVGNISPEGHVAWVRGFGQGKAMHRIDILAFPDRKSTFKWTEDQNIRMSLIGLTEQYQEDADMLRLMRGMGTD